MSPVRFAILTPNATALPSRAAWSKIVDRMNVTGAVTRNGAVGTTKPTTRPST